MVSIPGIPLSALVSATGLKVSGLTSHFQLITTKEEEEDFYFNTIQSYKRCISISENSFLSDEIGMSVHDLDIEKESIRIKHIGMNNNSYLVEVKINLLSREVKIGYYVLVFDESGTEIDDYLVFR